MTDRDVERGRAKGTRDRSNGQSAIVAGSSKHNIAVGDKVSIGRSGRENQRIGRCFQIADSKGTGGNLVFVGGQVGNVGDSWRAVDGENGTQRASQTRRTGGQLLCCS